MADERRVDLGFDIELARENLVRELIERGVVSGEQLAAWRRETSGHAADDDATAAWAVAWLAGWEHVRLHGVPASVNGRRASTCPKRVCGELGLSAALLEMHAHHAAKLSVARSISHDLTNLAFRLDSALLDRLENAASHEHDRYRANPRMQKELPWATCIGLVGQLREFAKAARALATTIASDFAPASANHERAEQSWRPRQTLLNAVWQHLYRNGVSRSDIVRLVPDLTPVGSKAARRDRVRKRVHSCGLAASHLRG